MMASQVEKKKNSMTDGCIYCTTAIKSSMTEMFTYRQFDSKISNVQFEYLLVVFDRYGGGGEMIDGPASLTADGSACLVPKNPQNESGCDTFVLFNALKNSNPDWPFACCNVQSYHCAVLLTDVNCVTSWTTYRSLCSRVNIANHNKSTVIVCPRNP